jgi:hypothetical protein
MKDLEELIRGALSDEAGRGRFDRDRWERSVTRQPAPRRSSLAIRLPTSRALAGLAVAAVLAAAIAGPLILLSRLGTGTREARPSSSTVEGYGIRVELPRGWDGWVRGPIGVGYAPYVHAANFLLPDEDDVVATKARRSLAPDQVVIVLIDQSQVVNLPDDDYPRAEPLLPLAVPEFGSPTEGVDPNHAFGRMTFSLSGRAFDLWVEFGSDPADEAAHREANDVLATLRIEPLDSPTGYVQHADGDDGLSITIPAAWTFHQDPSGPAEPRTVFAVGSWPFPSGGECAPTAAQSELPSEGTFFWLIEYRDPQGNDFPQRAEQFELDQAALANYECSVVPSYLLRFQDAGRSFQVHVAFGPDAPESIGPEVLRALESLEVTAPVPDACPAGFGPWSDPDCPWSAWTREVIDRAGYEIVGDNGSAFEVHDGDLGWTFSIHTTDEPAGAAFAEAVENEGYREAQVIAAVTVYSDGVRAVWTVQGLHVLTSGETGEPPPGPIIDKLVRASLAIDYDAIDTRP